jgi:hypothetical protein
VTDRNIPVALCFDAEPEDREVRFEASPWLGFERLLGRIGSLREELVALTGRPVRFNWFLRMDPQIAETHGHAGWVAERYSNELHALRGAGDGIGVHPHCWRWSTRRNEWITDHGDPDWVDHCIRVSFATYEAAFGESCRLVRFGDRFVTGRALALAAQLGARFDLSVEPGMPAVRSVGGAVSTGLIPSQALAPRTPYRPGLIDPVLPAGGGSPEVGLWEIPLTAINSNPLVPLWRRVARRVQHPRGPRYRTARLPPPWRATEFWAIVQRDLEATQRPYLAFATRTDSFITGRPPARHFEAKIAALRDWTPGKHLSFVTPDVLVAAVEHSPA